MLGHLRKQLSRLPVIKKSVEDYKSKLQKQRDDQLFARLMNANYEYRHAGHGHGNAL